MNEREHFRKLAIKRGLTPGALIDADPLGFDLLLIAAQRQFAEGRNYSEREVNEVLKHWLQTSGGMLAVDHVEMRRWLVDMGILTRDVYGQAYSRAPLPVRLKEMDSALATLDFNAEFNAVNEAEAKKRAARKAAWQREQKQAIP